MKVLIALILISLVVAKVAPPIAANDKKWVKSSYATNDCRTTCSKQGGHVCVGLHKSVCCESHWCVKNESQYDVWNCRKGFEIHVDECNDFQKRDSGFLETEEQ